MAYERVQKSGWHSPIQKKQSRIVPPPIDIQTQADSLPASGVTVSGIPSKAQREAIRRSLFEKWAGAGHIQTKLTIGEPGDKYEQEADRVASQVVNQINAPAPPQSTQSQSVQREAVPEEDELQMKSEAGTIQCEAMPEEEEDELQMKSEAGSIQREVLPDEKELPGGGGMTATPDLEASIQQARGSGQSLTDTIREPMEQAFGADFSGVKIHTDAQSDQLNQAIQAKAFTTGQDIFFRQGEYNPGSRGGQELIAHELTHVVQQKGNAAQRASSIGKAGHTHEQQTDAVVNRMTSEIPSSTPNIPTQPSNTSGKPGTDHYRQTWEVDTIKYIFSSGHGYRSEHIPGGPDITKLAPMNDLERAILTDLATVAPGFSKGERGERSVVVNSTNVSYRYAKFADAQVGIGTYFIK